ncbi:MAG TPA: ribonuclease R [Polyangiaceae bacterium]|jgi:ribonuclease R|nr:ribonuclease R [Polyangiaceae bacterium]
MSAPKPPRRADVVDLLASYGRSLHAGEIGSRLGVAPGKEAALSRVLDDLVFDGTVVALPGHRFRLASKGKAVERKEQIVEGYLTAHPRGFGFVAQLGDADDVFIPAEAMGGALHGDLVRARIVSASARGREGAIVEIKERRHPRVAGVLRKRGKSTWLEPEDTRVRGPIVLGRDAPGEDGEIAVVTIERYPETLDENPEGAVVEVLGAPGEPKAETKKILVLHAVDEEHSPEAVREAEAYGGEVDAAALEGRVDLTGIPLPTIDPTDARDHDDAVWAERMADGGYRVWVAIADVSHYVRPGTALDTSAKERGCSIYLPDRAIPMLPPALSSRLCSLLPGVVRLCLCLEATLDATGTVTSSRVVEGYMRSASKLTYEGVARALGLTLAAEKQPDAEAMRDELRLLREIASLLRARRMRRGALDLELPEPRILLDDVTKEPINAERRARDPGVAKAYQIVEELMLLANEAVAELCVQKGAPTIFRVHGAPDPTKILRFAALAQRLGIELDLEHAEDPKKFSAFMKKLAGHPQRALLDSVLVRSLKQATYDIANIGHFGLASKAYLHFTSPIRRYPDLAVHRVVRSLIRGERVDRSETSVADMQDAAQRASERERRAMRVERDVVDLYRALLMKDSVGDMFAGSVSSVVGSGVFVTLEEPFVDVLVRSEGLGPDAYEADEEGLSMIGVRSGDRVTLGDPMMVLVEDVSIARRTIYGRRVSLPASDEAASGEARPKRRGRSAGPDGRARGTAPAPGGKAGRVVPKSRAEKRGNKKGQRKRTK